MRMIVEQLVEWRLAGETEVLGESLPRRHFVHHKSHMTRPGLEARVAAVRSRRLTAWAKPGFHKVYKRNGSLGEMRLSDIGSRLGKPRGFVGYGNPWVLASSGIFFEFSERRHVLQTLNSAKLGSSNSVRRTATWFVVGDFKSGIRCRI
jgi:hypothetical protein